MKSITGIERVMDLNLESPECTLFEPYHEYRNQKKLIWLPEKYRQLTNIISSRMKIPREDSVYVNCSEIKEHGIDNILLLLVSKFYNLSPLDVISKVDLVRQKLGNSIVFSHESMELEAINSAEQLIATYQVKFRNLMVQYPNNPDLPHLDDHIFQSIIASLFHNTRAICIDTVDQLNLTEQRRIAEILYTRGHVGDQRFAFKINNGANEWKVWRTRSGEWIERTHDYTSCSFKQQNLPRKGRD